MLKSERKREIINALAIKYPNSIISESDLRIENTIANTKNRYTFPILKSNGVDEITEIKLDKNDKFFVTHLGLFLAAQLTTSPGKAILETYPNEQVFVTGVGFSPADLEIAYNGILDIKIGSRTFVENFSTKSFRFVPQTQKSAATNKNQQINIDGFVEWNNLEFSGASDTEIAVTLPLEGTVEMAAIAADTVNRLVLVAHGFLIKGAAR